MTKLDAEITQKDTTNEEVAAREPGQNEAEDADAVGSEPSLVAPQAGVQAEGNQGGQAARQATGRAPTTSRRAGDRQMKRRAYKFQTSTGRAPYDRKKEREINKRLAEELNRPKTKRSP